MKAVPRMPWTVRAAGCRVATSRTCGFCADITEVEYPQKLNRPHVGMFLQGGISVCGIWLLCSAGNVLDRINRIYKIMKKGFSI